MKRTASVSILVLALLILGALPAAAQSASGDFTFVFANSATNISFDVRQQASRTTGGMAFSGSTTLNDDDDAGSTAPAGPQSVAIKIDFDCLVVSGNRAAMSGIITQANIASYVGKRGLLTVEDNGNNASEPDRFTWGLFQAPERRWVATDAERTYDEGAGMSWFASDAERPDDRPVLVSRLEPGDCRSYSLTTQALTDLLQGAGDIQVHP